MELVQSQDAHLHPGVQNLSQSIYLVSCITAAQDDDSVKGVGQFSPPRHSDGHAQGQVTDEWCPAARAARASEKALSPFGSCFIAKALVLGLYLR